MNANQVKNEQAISACLAKIALEKLGISTLASRGSDSQDFHDLAVWSIEAALKAAYLAGANQR